MKWLVSLFRTVLCCNAQRRKDSAHVSVRTKRGYTGVWGRGFLPQTQWGACVRGKAKETLPPTAVVAGGSHRGSAAPRWSRAARWVLGCASGDISSF